MMVSLTSKLVVVKPIQSNLININQILRTDIEASNRGILALSSNGVLTLVAWIKKKIIVKHVEDISDALWQKGGLSELIAACHSGALLRYSLHQDSGLAKTLQLSAQSLLNLINNKDSNIKSLKSLRIWGHTKSFILLQPQSDRLVLMATNSGTRPNIVGIIKTPNLQSAHIAGHTIIVQPCTGSDIYIHDATNCKTIEVVTLIVRRPGVSYIQWDSLAFSFSASRITITDSERRLYVARFKEKTYHGKKNGIKTFHLMPHQIVWPAAFQPSSFNQFALSLSEEMLSVFCSSFQNEIEEFYYFTYDTSEGGGLSLQHKFTKQVSLLPGLSHELPDLFLTEEGLCMLTDKDCQVQNVTLAPDFESLLKAMEEALKEEDMEKISQIKTAVEEDLGIFLSSCNHMEGWVDKVETRSRQHAQLVDTLLSHLTKSAPDNTHKPSLHGLKELAKHHFKTLQDEMSNVLKYVDAEKVSQMLLVMVEQMNFYLKSVEAMKLPEGTQEDKALSEKFELWGDRPIKEILTEALETRCVKIAETYLSMKPWIYGPIEPSFIVSSCIDIVREVGGDLLNMGDSYKDEFKAKLFSSKELKEIQLLEEVLSTWKVLNAKENLALYLIKYIHRLSPHLISKSPKFWVELITYDPPLSEPHERELTILEILRWSLSSVNLVLLDLYARVEDDDILTRADVSTLWKYLLIRREETQLLRWINFQLCGEDTSTEIDSSKKKVLGATSSFGKEVSVGRSYGNKGLEKKPPRTRYSKESLLGGQMYCSDTESLYSLDSSVFEGADEGLRNVSESSGESISCYAVTNWPRNCFVFITQAMVDEVYAASFDLSEKLLNKFAQFGIFSSPEKGNCQKMVRRLINFDSIQFNSTPPEYEHKVEKSTLDKLVLESFVQTDSKSAFYQYVHANNLKAEDLTLSEENSKPWVSMVFPFQALEQGQAKETIFNLCLETLRYISSTKGDLSEDYFAIFLTMLFAPHASLSDFLARDQLQPDSLAANDVKVLQNILSEYNMSPEGIVQELASSEYPHLQPLIQKPASEKVDISVYDLLRGTVPFDIGTLFTWQKCNKYGYKEGTKQPSFSDEALCAKDGVKCSLDYYYYLKAGRPIYALASILLSVYSPEESHPLQSKELSVYGLALSSWPDKRVCSACVALLFIAKLNYETLRTLLYTADLIVETLERQEAKPEIQDNLRKSQLKLLTQDVKGFLFRLTSLSSRTESATKLVSYLEESIIVRVRGKPSSCESPFYFYRGNTEEEPSRKVDFSSKENLYYILMGLRLSRELCCLYKLPPPQKIMEFLAKENQWLVFLVAAQLFSLPSEVVRKTCAHFSAAALKDHIELSLVGNRRMQIAEDSLREEHRDEDYARSDHEDDDTSLKGKCTSSYSSASYTWDGKNPNFKNRRKVKRKKRSSGSVNTRKATFVIGSDYSKIPLLGSMEVSHSFIGLDQAEVRLPEKPQSRCSRIKWENEDCLDIFSVILKCHKQEKPALELLEACIAFRSSIFAAVAACYDSSLKYGCMAAYLYAYIPRQMFIKLENQSLPSVNVSSEVNVDELLSFEFLEKLICLYFKYEYVDTLMEAFKIFDGQSPVLPLVKAFEHSKLGSAIEEISKSLSHVVTDSMKYISTPDESKISELCVFIVCQGLDLYLKNRSLQKTFLKTFLPLSESYPFISDCLNWPHLFEVLNIMKSVNLPWKLFYEISFEKNNFNLLIKKVVKFLIDIEDYEKAFKVASLVDLNTADIYCCQLESEFDALKNNTDLKLQDIKVFLAESYSKMNEKKVPTSKASLFFETIAVKTMVPYFSFLALQYAVFVAQMIRLTDTETDEDTKACEESEKENVDIEFWKNKREQLELRMWCSYIEAKLEGVSSSTEFHPNVALPEEFKKWPWELGFSSRWLNDVDIENASVIYFGMQRDKDMKQKIMERFRTLIDGSSNEEKDKKLEHEVALVIKFLLENDLLVTACRIEKLYGIDNQDIRILKEMLRNSCSASRPSTDSPLSSMSSESLISKTESKRSPTKKRHRVNLKLGSFSRMSLIRSTEKGWLADLQRLSEGLSTFYRFAKRILLLCRLADELLMSYCEIINDQNPIQLLTEVLCCGASESLSLAKELIEALPIATKDVNSFLFDELISVINVGSSSPAGEEEPSLLFSWKTLDQKWLELLPLSETPTAIGMQLMDVYDTLSKDVHPDHVAKAQTMSVEVLIRAHDCFSLAANMEGINLVLQASPGLTKALLKHKQWSLMGRLLTGIRRYKEMSYILDVMRKNQQFERLLGRTSENQTSKLHSSDLDKTLVHFLKANYPNDKEMLRMVALHFLMFSELAKMWAEEAESIIKQVLESSVCVKPQEEVQSERSSFGMFFMKRTEPDENLSSASTTRDSGTSDRNSSIQVDYLKSPDVNLLKEAISCYCYAAQYCIQEKQLMSAMRHSRQGELIAVQMTLLKASNNNMALRVLGLSPDQLSLVMSEHLSVREIIIVGRAYDVNPDWSSSLFFNYIKGGNVKFLEDFLRFSFFSENIAQGIVKKIEKNGLKTEYKDRMAKLLTHIQEVDVVYKIASQLDLRTVVEECLESKSACFLKDTVFNRGIAGSGRV